MKLFLYLFLLTVQNTWAYTPQESQTLRKTLSNFAQAFSKAEGNMPPIEAFEHTSKMLRATEPPTSCQKSREFFVKQIEFDQKLNENSTEMARWFEQNTKKFDNSKKSMRILCSKENKFLEFSNKFQNIAGDPDHEDRIEDPEIQALDGAKSGKGEFASMKCALPPIIIIQFHRKKLSMVHKLFSIVRSAFESACDSNIADIQMAQKYLQVGESAFLSEADSTFKK